MHLLHPAHRGGARCCGQGQPSDTRRRGGHRLPAGLSNQGDRIRRHQRSEFGGVAAQARRSPLRAARGTGDAAAHDLSRPLARGRDRIEAGMSEQSEILPTRQSMGGIADQLTGIPLHFPEERRWVSAMAVASALLLLLMASVAELFTLGVGIWGINIPVNRAYDIHNYVWCLGIGHAGTLISALLLLTGSEWRNSLNRFAETMTLFAVVCAGIYPILHLGRPWYVYWMFPYPATMG